MRAADASAAGDDIVRRSLLLMMLAFAAPVLRAADVLPVTRPTTVPATLPTDASTPRGALRMVFNATDAGDESALRALLYTANPIEERVADATAKMSSSTTVLHKALLN